MEKGNYNKHLTVLRHTTEHVLMQAMENLYPNILKAMGPATEDGFYFDFDLQTKISEEDFSKIEKEMLRIKNLNIPISKKDTGGCCDGNNLFEHGLVNIDTLGVRGGKIHSAEEFVCLDSIKERVDLSLAILIRLAG